jgi:CHRD domain-containing protein
VKRFGLLVGVLGLAFAIAGGAGARSQASTVRLTAGVLVPGEEVPTPKGDVGSARGTFTATLTKSGTGATITWRLEFSGLTGPAIAAHIHFGSRGQAGPVRVPLCAPCTSGANGTETVDAAVVNAIESDGAYVNVHTATNPAGEIRNHVSPVGTVRTTLTARQERPKPTGNVSRARGVFTATVTKRGSQGTIVWRLTFSRLTGRAVAAHIHSGVRGRAGPVIVPLCAPCRSGARGTATVSASVLNALEAGRTYVNVHTRHNPAGEIRGQISAVPLTIS